MYNVVKRDGKLVSFDLAKISTAIRQAFDVCNKQYNPDVIDFLALKVTADFANKVEDQRVSVEDIQDSVETVLVQAGYADATSEAIFNNAVSGV